VVPLAELIDINSIDSIERGLHEADFVIVAIQQSEPLIQKQCIEKNIHSIDLSVTPLFIQKALQLNSKAQNQSLQIITGGLFPGLSGILVKEISDSTNTVEFWSKKLVIQQTQLILDYCNQQMVQVEKLAYLICYRFLIKEWN